MIGITCTIHVLQLSISDVVKYDGNSAICNMGERVKQMIRKLLSGRMRHYSADEAERISRNCTQNVDYDDLSMRRLPDALNIDKENKKVPKH